ncbi:MAG TPA: tetratricopeptide repeat protein [Planctomycetota bacterium]|nr:tetratricopeptide repeat protein [Planctomycetota bacterium]
MTGSTRRSLPAALKGPLIGLALLAALLALVEGLLRLLGLGAPPADVLRLPGQPIPEKAITLWDPDLYYRLRPSTAIFGRYHVNRHGVRGPEYDEDKPPGTLRLLCAGDSSTFGLGVGDDETWPAVTARILGGLLEGSARVEAINLGVPGYSTEQTRRQILRDGLALRPDAIVVCPTAQNDSSWRATGGDAVVLEENSALRARLDQWHLARMLGLGSVTESFRADAIRAPGSPGARPRVTPPEFAANLAAIIQAGREAGVPTLLIVTDHDPELAAAVPGLGESEELVSRVAAEQGARSVDSRPDFAMYAPYPMFSDGIHFVPLRQQLIARQVVLGLLAEPSLVDLGPRGEFVRAWAAAHVDGVAAHEAALRGGDRPPLFVALLDALDRGGLDASSSEWLNPAGTPTVVHAAIEQHDPLWGRDSSAYGAVRALIEALEAVTDQTKSDALQARRQQIQDFVQPRDLLEVLGGTGLTNKSTEPLARAVACFDAVIGFAPPRRDRRLAQAIALRKSNDVPAALELLDAVIALNDTCTEAYFERAQCLRKAGRRPESLPDLQRVIELEPDSALGQFVAGMLAFEQGRPEQAEPLLNRAIELDATMGRARFGLARILIDTGRLDEAEQQLEMAALMITDPVDVRPLLAEIEQRRAAAAADGAAGAAAGN